MKPTVYIETTIPSYYFDERVELMRDIARTREWWDHERSEYECFISVIVVDELAEGDYPHKDDCLALVSHLPRLEVNEEVLRIAEIYWTRKLMPRAPVRDALHLAIGSYFHMDVILTWNCQHLANANKTRHLMTLNRLLNLEVPQVVTPLQLQRQED